MDAHQFGAFVASCRREKKMTQAQLAARLQVTDKAVSRWERGIGFPDISTIQPLAEALGVSVLELMKSERMAPRQITSDEAEEAVTDTLEMAKQQRKQERKHAFAVLGITALVIAFLLFLDSIQWRWDILVFFGGGVVFPLVCGCGFSVLLGYGIWGKIHGKPWGQTVGMAFGLLLLLILFCGAFFFMGLLGMGPVPR